MDANKMNNLIYDLHKVAIDFDRYEHGLPIHTESEMQTMRNVIESYTSDNVQTSTDKSEKMRAVLQKLVDSFPEFETDEPIAGSDAVDTLCGMWDEIKEAIK